MRVFHGWRLETQKPIPQSVQVWQTVSALSHYVERAFLCVDQESHRFTPHPTSTRKPKVITLGENHAKAGLNHRMRVARYLLDGESGIYFDRHFKHMGEFLKYPRQSHKRMVFEWHELPSLTHEWRGKPVPDGLEALEAMLWKKCDAHVVISEGLKHHLEAKLGPCPKPVMVLENGGPDLRYLWRKGPRQEGPFIAVLSSLFRKAGERQWVWDFERHIPDPWRLHIYGPMDQAVLCSPRAKSFGWCPPAQVHRALSNADVVICPLLNHPDRMAVDSPLKIWEAVASGRPVLTSDIPAIRAALGASAQYFDPDAPEDWALALTSLAQDADRLKAMQGAAQALAPQITWSHRAKKLSRFFTAVMAGAQAA